MLTDTELSQLKGVDRLNLLAINWSKPLNADTIARLDALPQLNYLIITGDNPDPAIWNALLGLKKLKTLDLQGMTISAQRAQSLKTLSNLTGLGLTFMKSEVVESLLPTVVELTQLDQLLLRKSGVTDAALPHIIRMPNLKFLNLEGARITDAGLDQLAAVKGLAKLEIPGVKVTAAAVARLQQALPKCKIEWSRTPK